MEENKVNEESIEMIDINISKNKRKKKKKNPLKKSLKYLLFSLQIIIIIFLLSFLIGRIKKKNKNNLNDNKSISEDNNNINNNISNQRKILEMVYSEEELKYDSINNAAGRAKEFIKKSSDNIIFSASYILNEEPKISVVIPVFNAENTIKRVITSIQNQNISDFEIILVNDFSTDKSLNIIEDLKKKEQRIRILNNKENMGILYSRCVGTIIARGKYIFPLDDDDMLLDQDIFDKIVIKTAETYYFDIVEFRFIETNGLKDFFEGKISANRNNKHKKGSVFYQPELSNLALQPGKYIYKYNKNDLYIWGKCINSKIYKKVILLYGKERYSNNIINFEDIIMNHLIFQYAQNFTFIPKYGILRINSNTSASLMHTPSVINKFEMWLLDTVIDFPPQTYEGKQIMVNLFLKIIKNPEIYVTIKKRKYYNLIISILERIHKCEYIKEENKKTINRIVKVKKK